MVIWTPVTKTDRPRPTSALPWPELDQPMYHNMDTFDKDLNVIIDRLRLTSAIPWPVLPMNHGMDTFVEDRNEFIDRSRPTSAVPRPYLDQWTMIWTPSMKIGMSL